MRTKKHFAILTIALTCAFYFLFWYVLPPEVVEPRADNVPLLKIKVFFLGATTAIVITLLLVVALRKSYVKAQLAALKKYRHLLRMLVKRDFVTRYRRSVLGVLWSLLNPLLTMLVLTMIFSHVFRFEIPNFPIYLISGQLIYNFFSESTQMAMGSITSNAGIIKKVYVPKYIFPLSRILSSLINVLFSFFAFLLVFIVTSTPFHWTIFLIPIPILYTFVFSLGVGLMLSSLSVFFRDVTYLYGIFILLLMYLTPLFYPIEILPPHILRFIGLNPIYHYVDYFRNLALNGVIPGLWANAVCVGFALASLCCGVYVTMTQQDKYILYI